MIQRRPFDRGIDPLDILQFQGFVDLLNKQLDTLTLTLNDRRTSAPTSGSWVRGDIIYNSTPASGGYVGWVCTLSGTPGTWNGFGLIA